MLNGNFEELRWLAGAMACGLASAAMVFAKAVYPPAGATALMTAIDPIISDMGWYLIPVVLLCAVLTLLSSLLINNIQRRYPLYWWTPADLSKEITTDIEKLPSKEIDSHDEISTQDGNGQTASITITSEAITIPAHVYLDHEEEVVLEVLRNRLKGATQHESSST